MYICIVDFGSKPENGSLETRIRFYLEGVFLPSVGVIGILGILYFEYTPGHTKAQFKSHCPHSFPKIEL